MKATAVNFPDLLVIEGKYQIIPPHPFVPGKEGAGTIAALGEGVDGLSVGDRVMVQAEWGTYAQKLALPADHCFPMPDDMSFEEAAAIGIAYQTAHFALCGAGRGEEGGPGAGHRPRPAASGSPRSSSPRRSAVPSSPASRRCPRRTWRGKTAPTTSSTSRSKICATSIRNQVKEACGAVDVVVESVGGEVFDGAIRGARFRGKGRNRRLHQRRDRVFPDQLRAIEGHIGDRRELGGLSRPRSGMGTARTARAVRSPRRGQDRRSPSRRSSP